MPSSSSLQGDALTLAPLPSVEGLHVVCIGAGYVGGPTMAMVAAKCPCVTVTVVDLNAARIAAWNSDALPIFEPGLAALVAASRMRGNLFFKSEGIDVELRKADIIFVSVDTPTKLFGVGKGAASDVKNLELAARGIASACASEPRPRIVVEKSTVPVKTAETLRRVLHANSGSGGAKGTGAGLFTIISNPEFLAEGTAVADLESPSRVLIGGEETAQGQRAVRMLVALYAQWVPRERILTTNLWSSELSKLVANAFLAQRISSINAVSALCEASGADVDEVARAVGSDPRIGPQFLKASVGFGGSCFKKDLLNLVYLCETYGLHEAALYWGQVVAMNDYQTRRFTNSIVSRLFHTVSGKRIAILGFAFKKDTGDCRESAAAYVSASLLAERAVLRVFDPKAERATMLKELELTCGVTEASCPGLSRVDGAGPFSVCEDAYAAAQGAHAVVVLTEWPQFRELDWARVYSDCAKPAFVFDGRNLLNHAALRSIGFEVLGIGRPPAALQQLQAQLLAAATPPASPRKVVGSEAEAVAAALAAALPELPLMPPTT